MALRAGTHLHDERAIDLQRVDGQLGQVVERGESGSEVVDGDAHAQGADRFEQRDPVFDVFHDQAFGDLQFQSRCGMGVDPDDLLDQGDEAAITQLQCGDVYRNGNGRQAGGTPAAVIVHGRMQCPATGLVDQAGLLQYRNKPAGQHQSRTRIVPSDERLGAGDLPGRKIDLGLVVEYELPPFDCFAQLCLELQLAGQGLRHLAGIEQVARPLPLGALERRVGVPDE